jgi:hypothetical protein
MKFRAPLKSRQVTGRFSRRTPLHEVSKAIIIKTSRIKYTRIFNLGVKVYFKLDKIKENETLEYHCDECLECYLMGYDTL